MLRSNQLSYTTEQLRIVDHFQSFSWRARLPCKPLEGLWCAAWAAFLDASGQSKNDEFIVER